MAEETQKRGHDVTALVRAHFGDQNGVHVTSDLEILKTPFDLIVVHDPSNWPQSHVILNARSIPSPIYLLLIELRDSEPMLAGLADATYLGWSTSFDLAFINAHQKGSKARRYHHAISPDSEGSSGFRARYAIGTQKMYLSVGGYWAHKGMEELVQCFHHANPPDTTLVLMGYDNRQNVMPKESQFVRTLFGSPQEDVYAAMREADLYIMNSTFEGFGLAILEAMANRTPWIARDIAAAHDLSEFGTTYTSPEELCTLLHSPPQKQSEKVLDALLHTLRYHSIRNCVSEILSVLDENSDDKC